MRAVLQSKYGGPDVLRVADVPTPLPGEHEVRVRVLATPVTAADTMMRRGVPHFARLLLGLRRPKQPIPGTGFAGEVDAVGSAVQRFHPGDRVFGETTTQFSAHAEYVCLPEDDVLLPLPATVPPEAAAPACDGALTSLIFLQDVVTLDHGQRVLVNGAARSLGSAAVQLARHLGAHVTGVCSTRNVEFIRGLGADEVIDYTAQDFTVQNDTYDVVYDAVGKSTFARCRPVLAERGVYLSPVLALPLLWDQVRTARSRGQRARFAATGLRPVLQRRTRLEAISRLLEAGLLTTPIDRRYPLDAVAEAHRYVDTGHKRGNVVLTLGADD